jgi:predicted short-subunit dehydrogenase-like oxidoreductase (DUF2520 family)
MAIFAGMITELNIIGNGQAANFLTRAFTREQIKVYQWARNPKKNGQKPLSAFRESAPLTLLCITDDAVAAVSENLPAIEGMLAHTSGSVALSAIAQKHLHRAIFYPLMSLSADAQTPLQQVPFCLEADHPADLKGLEQFVQQFGGKHYRVNSQQRPYLHLAAVLAHNFSNHLFAKAYQVCQSQNLNFELLKPLLQQAVANLGTINPAQLQTGPALRGDEETLNTHRQKIKDPLTLEIYNLLTSSIQKSHEEEL